MLAAREHAELIDLMKWIDENTSGVTLPTDDRTMLATGCFDVAIEYQAAIALLCASELYGAALSLLRVLSESLVRGLWLLFCASETELQRFKIGRLPKTFDQLVKEVEGKLGTPEGVLSTFKKAAWVALNGFTHTGFHQVSRRHSPGKVEGNYPEYEIAKAICVAGALGLIASAQVISMSNRQDLLPIFAERMSNYARSAP